MAHIFHITTGDTDGIGLEVTLKSLIPVLETSSRCKFIIWVHKSQVPEIKKFLSLNKELRAYSEFLMNYGQKTSKLSKFNFLVNTNAQPAHWFSECIKLCVQLGDSIITAPLSKTQIKKEGFDEIGHTDILKSKTKSKELYMAFVGNYFSMILYSGHVPVYKVNYHKTSFLNFLNKALDFHRKHKNKKSDFLILGLNPHAGDEGIIGKDDEKIAKLATKYGLKKPLAADSAFVDYRNFKNDPTFISLYHDQGLIPFKMAHGFSGFHFTLGLPFVRTSVDHGTGKDIYGKNKAEPTSMIDAIQGAINLKKGSKFL